MTTAPRRRVTAVTPLPARRALLARASGLCLALALPALAAARTIAIVSLIGDKVELVVPQMTTGSYLDRNLRDSLVDRSGAFDRFALVAAEKAISAVDPAFATALISIGPSSLHDYPERLFEGVPIALPGAVVDELERVRASHLLLITKFRDVIRVPVFKGTFGIGKVRGLGFYYDSNFVLKLRETGESAPGFLAPFAYFLLSLVDVRTGLVVAERKVTQVETLSIVEHRNVSDPWNILDAAGKTERLEQLIRQGLEENVRLLLKGL